MSAPEHDPLCNVHDLRDRVRASSDARAYGGPAHGEQWTVDPAEPPPWVELPTGFSSCLYRLARHPHTGRPARDHRGDLLYVPLNDVIPPTDIPGAARILTFPGRPRLLSDRPSRRPGAHSPDSTRGSSAALGF